jgi:serine-type D-Ala-D-Ala carboxypeptidase (penicillin-binding protein 5/6)
MEGESQDKESSLTAGLDSPSFTLPPIDALVVDAPTDGEVLSTTPGPAAGAGPLLAVSSPLPGPPLPPPPLAAPPLAPVVLPEDSPPPPEDSSTRPEDSLPERGADRRQRRRRRRRRVGIVVVALIVVVAALVVVQLRRALPRATVQATLASSSVVPGTAPNLAWPSTGYAAVAIPALGYSAQSGSEVPVPVASLTKMMVAVVILRDHPLAAGVDGPSVTITAQDVAEDNTDVSTDQSTVPVTVGEVLTERQLLEGLLIRSANNMAFTLARWDAGSVPAFIAKMNAGASQLGMAQTHYADVSGYDPASVSTPADSLKVAARGLADPTFAAIVAMPTVTLPVVGTVPNIVSVIGSYGIVGVKSGITSAAGPCLVLASNRTVGGRTVQAIAAATNQQPTGSNVFGNAAVVDERLMQAALGAVTESPLATPGDPVGTVGAAWGGTRHDVPVVTTAGANVIAVPGQAIATTVIDRPVATTATSDTSVGRVVFTVGPQRRVVPLRPTGSVPTPSLWWRLTRI